MSRWLCALSITVVVVCSTPPLSAQKGKPASPSQDAHLSVLFAPGNPIAGDGWAYEHGTQNIRAIIFDLCNDRFDLDTNIDDRRPDGGRRLLVNLPRPATLNASDPWSPTRFVDGYMHTLPLSSTCAVPSLLDLPLDGTVSTSFMLRWTDADVLYTLRWNAESGGSAKFTCANATAGGSCTEWTLAPRGGALLYRSPVKRPTQETLVTGYAEAHVAFEAALTKL